MLGALHYCCHVTATSSQRVLTGHWGPLTSLGGRTKPCPHGAPASLAEGTMPPSSPRKEGGREEEREEWPGRASLLREGWRREQSPRWAEPRPPLTQPDHIVLLAPDPWQPHGACVREDGVWVASLYPEVPVSSPAGPWGLVHPGTGEEHLAPGLYCFSIPGPSDSRGNQPASGPLV